MQASRIITAKDRNIEMDDGGGTRNDVAQLRYESVKALNHAFAVLDMAEHEIAALSEPDVELSEDARRQMREFHRHALVEAGTYALLSVAATLAVWSRTHV